jgi:DNA-directed RNA polymerase specialized sigma24 family protein
MAGMAAGVAQKDKLFSATHWTVVVDSGGPEGSERTQSALTQLCQTYWRPLYVFLLLEGHRSHDAQDLTQGFFADFMAKRSYIQANPNKGKFRSFLLGSLKNYISNQQDRGRALKRGQGVNVVSLTQAALNEAEELAARSHRPAEDIYEREWALTMLRRVIALLEKEYHIAGKSRLFEALKGYLGAEGCGAVPYAELTRRLSRSAVNLRQDVARLRARYRALLREEVRQTVAGDEEVEGELMHLREVMAR